jgi:hypothetical protein
MYAYTNLTEMKTTPFERFLFAYASALGDFYLAQEVANDAAHGGVDSNALLRESRADVAYARSRVVETYKLLKDDPSVHASYRRYADDRDAQYTSFIPTSSLNEKKDDIVPFLLAEFDFVFHNNPHLAPTLRALNAPPPSPSPPPPTDTELLEHNLRKVKQFVYNYNFVIPRMTRDTRIAERLARDI